MVTIRVVQHELIMLEKGTILFKKKTEEDMNNVEVFFIL